MKKILLLCGMLLALSATVASAAGTNIAWDNCVGAGGVSTKTFACNTNAGSNALYLSVMAPGGVSLWTAFEAEIILGFNGPQPAWWMLRNQAGQTTQCRNGALGAFADFSVAGCTDPYLNQGAGGVGTYQNGPNIQSAPGAPVYNGGPRPDRARLLLVFAIPAGNEYALNEGEEYYVSRITLSNIKSVGTGSCAGCPDGGGLNVVYIRCVQPAGAPGGNVDVFVPAQDNCAGFQAAGETACAGLPTPAVRATWGSVKALYR
jgi:hypothetical protein